MIRSGNYLTVDGEVFCDALRCLYFLLKHWIPHTTNFLPLRKLCIQMGNLSLENLALEGSRQSLDWTGLVDWTGGLDRWTGLVDWTGGLTPGCTVTTSDCKTLSRASLSEEFSL